MPNQLGQIDQMNAALRTNQPFDPNDILKQVLIENPGLAKIHTPENTSVIFATPQRTKMMNDLGIRGGLEYWPQDEPGEGAYTHPTNNKGIALEIHDPNLMNNPSALKNAIYGDLIHGMRKDPVFSGLREDFKNNYTPQELGRIQNKQSWWEDANGMDANDMAIHDAYIRGYLNENGVAMQGQKEMGGTMYSPKQLQILQRMQDYIKRGK